MAERELYGVFVRGRDDNPVAIFSDADQAQRWRRSEHGDAAMVLPLAASIPASSLKDAQEAFDAAAPAPPAPVAAPDPDAALKGQIRADLEAQERRERLTAEVKREMADDRKDEGDTKSEAATAAPAARGR